MKSESKKNFSPFIITGIILLLEIVALIVGFIYFQFSFGLWLTFGLHFLSILIGIIVVNCRSNGSYKISWLMFIIVFPFLGIICFIFFANKKFTKREMRLIKPIVNASKKALDSRFGHDDINSLNEKEDADAINIATYIRNFSDNGIYSATKTTYFSWGEDGFPVMLEKLKKAKHYIFLEYFIICDGEMWQAILEILRQKAAEGLDVRIIYDDFGSRQNLPKKYDKQLVQWGIKTIVFNKIKPLFAIRMNNRDHRKILVIDGYVGFTGGINIADEYINKKVRFGKWKDNVIMLEGEGVFGLTSLFLSNWAMLTKIEVDDYLDFSLYFPRRHQLDYINEVKNDGFVQPYGSLPFTFETIGANVYLSLINRAKKYIHITTPYLILDDTLIISLINAAKSGVEVKIITPHIPDKKVVHEITRSNYRALLEFNVQVYEYKPGFIHEKTIVVDGIMGTVGTINFDYRSLFLHMENGTFLYKCECIKDMENDFQETLKECIPYSYEMINSVSLFRKMWWAILRIIAPLM